MASINVSKGLFRLWVLVALCWVVPLTVLKFDKLTATHVGYYDPNLDQNPFSRFDPERLQENNKCRAAKDFADLYINCKHIPFEGSVSVTIPIWGNRIEAAEWIFLPPLVLLLLGYGVLWALRGFKE